MKFRGLPAGFMPNIDGRCPDQARGKRVEVVLRNGARGGDVAVSTVTPPGWSADGTNGCRWGHTEGPASSFDIIGFKVL